MTQSVTYYQGERAPFLQSISSSLVNPLVNAKKRVCQQGKHGEQGKRQGEQVSIWQRRLNFGGKSCAKSSAGKLNSIAGAATAATAATASDSACVAGGFDAATAASGSCAAGNAANAGISCAAGKANKPGKPGKAGKAMRIGLREVLRAFRAISPIIFGLALTQLARVTITHVDSQSIQQVFLNDVGALVTLAAMLAPCLAIAIFRISIPSRLLPLIGYGSIALAAGALLTSELLRVIGWHNDTVCLTLIVLGYCSEIASTYFWLQAARVATPAQAIVLVFAATIVKNLLFHLALGLLWVISYQVALVAVLIGFSCVSYYLRHGFPQLAFGTEATTNGNETVRPASKRSEKQSQGLLGIAVDYIPRSQMLVYIYLGIALFTVSVGLLLGFVPENFTNNGSLSNPLPVLASLAINDVIVLGGCLFFIAYAWRGRLWQLSVNILKVFALLVFAILASSLLLGDLPLHIDTILVNALYALLSGFVWYLAIFFMGQAGEHSVENNAVRSIRQLFRSRQPKTATVAVAADVSAVANSGTVAATAKADTSRAASKPQTSDDSLLSTREKRQSGLQTSADARDAESGARIASRSQTTFLNYAIGVLYCFLLPRALGRSVLFPLLDGEQNFRLFVIVLSGVSLLALAVLLSVYLRGVVLGHQRQSQLHQHDAKQAATKVSVPVVTGAAVVAVGSGAAVGQVGPSAPGAAVVAVGSGAAVGQVGPSAAAQQYTSEALLQMRVSSMERSVNEIGRRFGLSAREIEVLTLYALGHTRKRVASELYISIETVNTHIKNIYAKTNISSRQKMLDLLDEE